MPIEYVAPNAIKYVARAQPAPAEEALSGEHIVIGHDLAPWGRMTSCNENLPHRTRDAALRLAIEIFRGLETHPEAFAEAVHKYSEDCDAVIGGDFGSWSSREVAPFERRLDILRSLKPGDIAPPRETHVGFEIIRRTPERPRQLLAADLLSLDFNPWAAYSGAT